MSIIYNNIFFDVYNLWYRVVNKNESLSDIGDKKIPINAICKFFELTDGYIKKYGSVENCRVWYLFDNAKTSMLKNRKLLDKDYKKNREIQPDWFYTGINMIELIAKYYRDNSVIYRVQNVEADDFVAPLIDNYINEHDKVLMFSTDMDWSRCLLNDTERDVVVNQYTRNNEILTVKSFEEKFGFKPTYSNVCFWKTLYGDQSDCILPTLSNYPKQYFLDCINRYTDVSRFISDALNGKITYLDAGWRIKIKNCAERMMLNWQLVSNMEIDNFDLENWKVECAYKPNKLLIIYNTLNVVGRFDKRVKNENKGSDLLSMLEGETVERV